MKNTFFSIILFSISSLLTAQELPELPMKNGMAYYTFDHKLSNTKGCLVKYVANQKYFTESFACSKKLQDLVLQLNLKQGGIYKNTKLTILGMPFTVRKECLDTLKTSQGFQLMKTGDNMWAPAIIEFFRKHIMQNTVYADIEIIFLSKNEYRLIFKGLTFNYYWHQAGKTGVEILDIGELYQKTKDSGKINKKDIKFFEDLNFYIKSTDEIILKALTETYKSAEL